MPHVRSKKFKDFLKNAECFRCDYLSSWPTKPDCPGRSSSCPPTKFKSKTALVAGIRKWINDEASATLKYDDIATWDTSEVTDMRYLHYIFSSVGSKSCFIARSQILVATSLNGVTTTGRVRVAPHRLQLMTMIPEPLMAIFRHGTHQKCQT